MSRGRPPKGPTVSCGPALLLPRFDRFFTQHHRDRVLAVTTIQSLSIICTPSSYYMYPTRQPVRRAKTLLIPSHSSHWQLASNPVYHKWPNEQANPPRLDTQSICRLLHP